MLVSEAAKQIGLNTQTLRLGLQQRVFPFGEAIKTSENRYVYHINPVALQKYLDGELICLNEIYSTRT
jgi:hypothetical protein